MGLDDRFTGRGGWGEDEDRGVGGADRRGSSSGADARGDAPPRGGGEPPSDDGYGAQGPGQGHTGGDIRPRAPEPVGGYRSGQWGVGHQGANAAIGGHHVGPHRGTGPVGYVRADARIRENVCEALTDHADIDASRIEVGVEHGEVTLRGTVPDRATRHLAEDVALQCAGVRDVLDELRVLPEDRAGPSAEDTRTHRA